MKKTRFSLNIIKIFMKNQMQNRTNIILDIANMIARCFIVFLLYAYIFKIQGGTINGVDYKTTMWSMFMYFCIMTLNLRHLDNEIMSDVKSGNVEMFMNRPRSYLTLSFMRVLGQGLFSFVMISIIGAIIMIISIGVPSVNPVLFIPTLILALVLGQILALFIYGLIGLLSFYIQDIRPVHWVVDKLIMVLGGSYLPISMFPKVMKIMAYASPFGAINFASSTVYDSWNTNCYKMIGMQIIWILVFGLILFFVYKKSKEKAMINGG